MCRMLLAVGDVCPISLSNAILRMAADQNGISHEGKEQRQNPFLHSEGWSLSYLDKEDEWKILRSEKEVYKDEQYKRTKEVQSSVKIFHVRKATNGTRIPENTHNFYHELPGFGPVLLSHNGHINDQLEFHESFTLKGNTDSEALFYKILSKVKDKGISLKEATILSLKELDDFYGANLIITSRAKSYVFVYYKTEPRYFTMQVAKSESALIVSSERVPLPNLKEENWFSLTNGDVVEIDHATAEFSLQNIMQRSN